MISTVVASRNDTLLFTRGEKRDRRRVKEGRMTKAAFEEKKKVKTEASLDKLSPESRATGQDRMDTKNAEEERKDRVLTDAELAAKLQPEQSVQ